MAPYQRVTQFRNYFALSVAFCLTGLLALSSCDLEFWEDDDEAEVEAMEMRGFFTSADDNGGHGFVATKTLMYIWKEDESTGKLDVTIVSAGDEFGEAQFKHVGQKIIDGDGNKKPS